MGGAAVPSSWREATSPGRLSRGRHSFTGRPESLGICLWNVWTAQKAQLGFGGFGVRGFSFPWGFWIFVEVRIVLGVLGSVVKSGQGAAGV